jgi:hypothetical protein
MCTRRSSILNRPTPTGTRGTTRKRASAVDKAPAAKMRAQSSTRTHHDDDEVVCLSSDEVHASSDEAAAQTPAGAAPVVAKTKQSASESELHTA